MALLGWVMMGIAIWHFTVFLPDRFWAGIVGAFLGAVIGAVLFGSRSTASRCPSQDDTNVLTVLEAVPGTLLGLAVMYWLGMRQEARVRAPAAVPQPMSFSPPPVCERQGRPVEKEQRDAEGVHRHAAEGREQGRLDLRGHGRARPSSSAPAAWSRSAARSTATPFESSFMALGDGAPQAPGQGRRRARRSARTPATTVHVRLEDRLG